MRGYAARMGPPAPSPSDNMRRLARRLVDPGRASALDMLAIVTNLRADLTGYEEACVATARRSGLTWTEIASVVGQARQNTQRKYAHLDEARSPDRRARR